MKTYVRMTVCVFILFILSVVLFYLFTADDDIYSSDSSRKMVAVLNDIARKAEDNRSDLTILDETDFDVDFVILDMTDNVLYYRSDTGSMVEGITVEKAIQKHLPYEYLVSDDSVWGSAVILNDGLDEYKTLRARLVIGFGSCGLLMLAEMTLFGLYITKNIIKPFKAMQSFAGKVAEGKLDEPLKMDRNNMFGVFSESFDIMREELADSRQRETELQKKERELVASLSHDLKTPVTGIKLAAELLQMRISVKTQAQTDEIVFGRDEIAGMNGDAESILQKAEQIDALVSDLFTSTLDDLGEFKVNCSDVDSGVLRDIVRSYDDRDLVVMDEIPAVILHIDTRRMAQVIGNIISNSYKYANTAIDISFGLSEGFLEMRIQDHGPGVPRDELDLITNKFYRGRQWADSTTDGNGLGLYIAKMLMKRMNGDLVPDSSGDGFTVTLVIPLS